MISDGKNPDFQAIIERDKFISAGGTVCCGHDFWDEAKKLDYGDVILCGQCNTYYAKIKHMPWLGTYNVFYNPGKRGLFNKTYHQTCDCFVRVPLRVTDG